MFGNIYREEFSHCVLLVGLYIVMILKGGIDVGILK